MPSPTEIKSKIADLKKEGWQLQFTTNEPRLSEAVELYESLGYEVRLEPACDELPLPDCASCYELFCERYKGIFVRRAKNVPESAQRTYPDFV
jgi:hypothetical protein